MPVGLTLATAVLLLVQVPPGTGWLSIVTEPTHILLLPFIGATALTVNTEVVMQPVVAV